MKQDQSTTSYPHQDFVPNNIGSQHYINSLETNIIQIARALAVEHQIPVDPDAKEMTRKIIQEKINSLLSEETRVEIKKLRVDLEKKIKSTNMYEYDRKVYDLLKLTRLDDV